MADTVLLCADGSGLSTAALRAGCDLLGAGTEYLLVTVTDSVDPMLATGSGFAGGTLSPEELGALEEARLDEARATLDEVAAELGLHGVVRRVLIGSAGPSVVALADEVGARAIVIGSRGRGGIKRALLGSVSDHVVRHASCPVVVTGAGGDA